MCLRYGLIKGMISRTPTELLVPATIPLRNVLWAEVKESGLVIEALIRRKPKDQRSLFAVTITDTLTTKNQASAVGWAKSLMDVLYDGYKRQPRLKILINPVGGPGIAVRSYETEAKLVFDAARCHQDVQYTEYQSHASDIVREMDINGYDCIVCVSGDGIVHEVINGLATRPDGKTALKTPIGMVPAGSGNALSACLLGPDASGSVFNAALGIVKGTPLKIDLCSMTQGDTRTWSFLSQAFAQIADVDLKTEWMRKLGDIRFILGFLWSILFMWTYEAEVAIRFSDKDKESIRKSYFDKYDGSASSIYDKTSQVSVETDSIKGVPDDIYGTVNDPLPRSTVPTSDTVITTTAYGNSSFETEDGWFMYRGKVGSFYAGKAPYMAKDFINFPYALPHDGFVDIMFVPTEKHLTRGMALNILTEAEKGNHFKLDYVHFFKAEAFRITPLPSRTKTKSKILRSGWEPDVYPASAFSSAAVRPGGRASHVSVDGERAPYKPFQVEVHKGLATVMSPFGRYTKTED